MRRNSNSRRAGVLLADASKFGMLTAGDNESFAEVVIAAAAEGKPASKAINGVAYSGGILRVNWGLPVVVDLSQLRAQDSIVFLLDHYRDKLVGQGTATIGARNIKVAGTITGDCDDPADPAHKVAVHARGGFRWPLSIGVWPDKVEEVSAGAKVSVNGRSFAGPCYVVRGGVLRETSFVSIGGDENASAQVAASAAKEPTMEPTFEDYVKACGKDVAKLTADEKGKLQAAYDGLKAAGVLKATVAGLTASSEQPEPAPKPTPKSKVEASVDDDPAETLRAKAAAEYKRQAMVAELAGGKYPKLAAQALEEDWDEGRLKAEIKIVEVQASRPKAPAIHGGDEGSQPLTADVVEAALCLSAGPRQGVKLKADPDKYYSEQTLDAAAKVGRISIQETLMLVASLNGWTAPGRMTSNVFKANHKAIVRAAFGGLQAGVSSIDTSGILSNVAGKFLLDSFNATEQVWRRICSIVPAGDFKTMTFYRLTSGGGYQKVAKGGKLKHGTLSEENFTNKAETYGKLLTIDRVDQINDDMGAITKVPAQLGGDAGRALNGVFWTAFMDNTSFFSAAHKNLVAGSARPYYLLVDPVKAGENLAVMQVAFLDGRDTPVVETAEADFNTLGIQMRSYHDWGCAKAEYRGGVKSLTALSLDSIEAAHKLFLDQTINGTDPLGVRPNILLVATGDFPFATRIYKSAEIRDTTASTKTLVANVFEGMFEVLCSSYLANT